MAKFGIIINIEIEFSEWTDYRWRSFSEINVEVPWRKRNSAVTIAEIFISVMITFTKEMKDQEEDMKEYQLFKFINMKVLLPVPFTFNYYPKLKQQWRVFYVTLEVT